MGYSLRYTIDFTNEDNNDVHVDIMVKDGAVDFTGSKYISFIDSTHLLINSLTADLPALVPGVHLLIDGTIDLVVTAVTYPGDSNYHVTFTGDASSLASGVHMIQIGETSGPITVEALLLETMEKNINSDGGDILDSIYTSELVMTLNVREEHNIDWETFIDSNADDWMVIVTLDSKPIFHGFIDPSEGPAPFQDKPYTITLHCTDGLKLLSKQALVKADGSEFDAKHTLIDYVHACLVKTNLQLPIKVYSNIYYNPMVTRSTDISADMFDQAFLDYRTFMNSPTTFMNCYDVLQAIFNDNFHIVYDAGYWVIYRKAEWQVIYSDRYYTIYDIEGGTTTGAIDPEDYAQVGKNNIIYPINETQNIASNYANKSVRNTFKYDIWPEIPRNNKFERGTLDVSAPNTATEKYYTIDTWQYGRTSIAVTPLGATTAKVWRKSTFNAYNVEIDREIQMQIDSGNPTVLLSQQIPVNENDKINISFQIKILGISGAGPATYLAGFVFIIPASGTRRWLENDNDPSKGVWTSSSIGQPIKAFYSSSDDTAAYFQINIDSDTIPVDGELYIAFRAGAFLSATDIFIKDFSLTYTPYIAGGYVPVTGEYWLRTQNNNFPDNFSEDIQISDTRIGTAKGCLWFFGVGGPFAKTNPDWWRYGLGGTEIRAYNELVNLTVYNLTYRRFYKISGDFNGTQYSAANDQTNLKPLSFTPRYSFEDLPGGRLFVLVPPVQIDIAQSRFNGTFVEVYKTTQDGQQEVDSATFNYLFE